LSRHFEFIHYDFFSIPDLFFYFNCFSRGVTTSLNYEALMMEFLN
jgi:hypothetical protein